jgi:hypothetical protein
MGGFETTSIYPEFIREVMEPLSAVVAKGHYGEIGSFFLGFRP